MLQKMTLALVSIVAIGSLAACGLMWSLASDFQAASTELLTQSREANAELLKQNQKMMAQLSTIAKSAPAAPNLMEWVPVKVQLVAHNAERSPGAGFTVRLFGRPISTAEEASLNEQPDDSGIADFGLVRPGSYKIFIDSPWGQQFQGKFVAKPGVAHTEILKCPTEPPNEVQVRPVVEWPKELEGQDVAALLQFEGNIVTKIGEEEWKELNQFYLLVCPDGRIARYERANAEHGRTGQPKLEALGIQVIRFYDAPQVFENAIPLRDASAEFDQIGLVKLPRTAGMPGKNQTLDRLSDSNRLELYNPFKAIRQHATYTRLHLDDQAAVAEIQDVAIKIDPADVAMARALLAVEEFPALPNDLVGMSALNFIKKDKDRNIELSKEEAAEWGEEFQRAFAEFPITFPEFIPKCVEFMQKWEKERS